MNRTISVSRLMRVMFALDLLPEQLRGKVLDDTFRLRLRLTRAASVIGVVVATALFLKFEPAVDASILTCAFALVVGLYGAIIVTCVIPLPPRSNSTRRLLAFNTLIFLLGSAWTFFLCTILRSADPHGSILIFSVFIGIISTTISSGPLSSTLLFWLPLNAGIYFGLYFSDYIVDPAFEIALLSYSALTFFTMVFLNRKMLERSVNAIRLQETNETIKMLLRDFVENASDWLWETDAECNILHPSARFAEVARRPVAEIGGHFLEFMADGDDALLRGPDDPYAALRELVRLRRPFRDMLVPVSTAGERHWWSLTGKPKMDDHGAFAGYRGVGSDVTAMHRSRQRIAYLAQHDTLTDLVNRTAFGLRLEEALGRGMGAALLYLDLDQFKAVNDSYGHALGDTVLRTAANRLRGAIRERDLAARLGGDEFAVLLPSNDRIEATAVAERIIDRLSRPYRFDGVALEIGVSIGIALAPDDGDGQEQLHRNADLALYRAKNDGRGTWRLFDQAMDHHLQEQRSLRRDIKHALNEGQLFVEYQPVVVLDTGRISGLEALVRWRHPQRGVIGPGEFIAIAERCGLIGAVTRFVLVEAVALAERLPSRISVAINLSALHLRESTLFNQISEVISASGIPPSRIGFEVTESAMLATDERTLDNLDRLRRFGCLIAIDDFGTGFSSLSTLRTFPFDRLKIDRSFISELGGDGSDAPIVRAVVELGKTLGLHVIAEGVEQKSQADLLRGYGCMAAQGFLFSPPVPKDVIMDWFGADHPAILLATAPVDN